MGSTTVPKENSMRYHGRPLELTTVLLGMNYSQSIWPKQGPVATINWDQELLSRLEPG
jgi:hypothetical protein